ncbi:12-oxophytodienoate reductase [Phytophthora palmivora]|uniref:12-oxophytodienoate reductase n=1 Tax=Phytophthora palmivora TaxID=4796 RepID=A0A2P4XGH6_9STRA|nr:12-oxophytodienoate reductase [Phytophthora palmivora]
MWRMGRQSHSSFNKKGNVVSASVTPRALATEEIAGVVEDFRKSAVSVKIAGFNDVGLHGTNVYLIDQFLQSVTNHRTDKYGGSFENRARFLLQLVQAAKTVSHRIALVCVLFPTIDSAVWAAKTTLRYRQNNLGYLAVLDGDYSHLQYSNKSRSLIAVDAKTAFKGMIAIANNYTRDTAEGVVCSGAADLPMADHEVYYNSVLGGKFYNDYLAYHVKNELDIFDN